VLFNSGGKHETMFPIITYYYFSIDQILKIVLSEMETKKIASLAIILTNLKKCDLHQTILKYWFFRYKMWPNDLRIDCNLPSNLLELIEKYLNFEKKIIKFEGSFEQDDLLNI
jgi:hypothetical protein